MSGLFFDFVGNGLSWEMADEMIVVTDGHTLNPGDLDWTVFGAFGSVKVYERTARHELEDRCTDATIIVTNKTVIDSNCIGRATNLKLIAVTATGYNVVDVEAASRKKIPVCNVPGYGTDSVAQHTFALILELTNHVGANAGTTAAGDWSKSPDWCYTASPMVELAGKTLGIIGFGKIGKKVAEIGRAFGMNILFYNKATETGETEQVSLQEVFTRSDVVSLHCPATRENAGFVDDSLLSLMKPSAYLINTARGQLINENALATSLRSRKIAGAALDVLSTEPPVPDHPLIGLHNCLITPHTAWLSVEARKRIMDATFENIRCALRQEHRNVVNH